MITRIFCASLLAIAIVSCGGNKEKQENVLSDPSLSIACAANMQVAMDSIVILFEQETGISSEITSGSSGMLTAQIKNGAPYDVFISANMDYPNTLFQEKMGEEPLVYAQGRLLLAVNSEKEYSSIEMVFNDPEILSIGLADQKTAPYGMAANEYLVKSNQKEKYEDKWVIGESIGQINQYLTSDAVDAAFTSYSFRVRNEEKFQFFDVDQKWFSPINQGVIQLNNGAEEKNSNATSFVEFLSSSKKCRAVLTYFGYIVP